MTIFVGRFRSIAFANVSMYRGAAAFPISYLTHRHIWQKHITHVSSIALPTSFFIHTEYIERCMHYFHTFNSYTHTSRILLFASQFSKQLHTFVVSESSRMHATVWFAAIKHCFVCRIFSSYILHIYTIVHRTASMCTSQQKKSKNSEWCRVWLSFRSNLFRTSRIS